MVHLVAIHAANGIFMYTERTESTEMSEKSATKASSTKASSTKSILDEIVEEEILGELNAARFTTMDKKRKKRKPYTPPYTEAELLAIWNKGRFMPKKDPSGSKWRKMNLVIVSTLTPMAIGIQPSVGKWTTLLESRMAAKSVFSNLRPLQWEANVERN